MAIRRDAAPEAELISLISYCKATLYHTETTHTQLYPFYPMFENASSVALPLLAIPLTFLCLFPEAPGADNALMNCLVTNYCIGGEHASLLDNLYESMTCFTAVMVLLHYYWQE